MKKTLEFFAVKPEITPDKDGHWRIRLEWSENGNATLVEEKVLPEKVTKRANRILAQNGDLMLTEDEIRWLHEQLGALIAVQDSKKGE